MEILDRLERLKEEHRDARGELSYESQTCLQARAIIEGLNQRVLELEKAQRVRFDLFFAAALQGLLGRATAATLMDGNPSLVKRAHNIAVLCIQARPGEGS